MYKPTRGQMTLFDHPIAFAGAKLNPENRWVKMAALIPWDLLDQKYSEQFGSNKTGCPAKAARMALGSHIIKEKFGLSDEETVEHIKESPYLQWFIGLPAFTDKAPFDASTMTWFRKRLTPDMLAEVNAYIIGTKKKDDDEDSGTGSDLGSGAGDAEPEEAENKGTLILDATCAPADIKYPTDVALLNTAREKLERMITELHEQTSQHKKPRTYKRIARKDYLRFARNRRPTIKAIRKAIRQQLGYVRRDLTIIERLLESGLNLSEKSKETLGIIRTLYSQQEEMYQEKKHQVEDRIVSIHQPWIRPMVRGKTNSPTEFGAKIAISMVDGYASVERLDWNAFNETSTLQETVERYRKDQVTKEITLKQWLLINTIQRMDNKSPNLMEIAKAIGTSRQNVSKMISSLEKKGMVKLHSSNIDQRAVYVTLTQKSLVYFNSKEDAGNTLLDRLFSGIPPAETERMARFIYQMLDKCRSGA